ncbi:MAG: aminomethyl-transferring glycine dehydrogenase subunit GcvPB [Chloroflexi bacterium]|nr:aminomethyl-transferring glycine dehydrogenase subunit GcvPB [Chloroflexota bacterium]
MPSPSAGPRTGLERRPLLMDQSRPGRTGATVPSLDVPEAPLPPARALREDLPLPEVSERDLVSYFHRLSRLNYSVDEGFYPLGSCTMKYNPKWHEEMARLPGFAQVHPLQPEETVQGALQLMYELQQMLAEIVGMDAASLCPLAGAHGELTGMMMVRAYHRSRNEPGRAKVLVPDSAHGTNPASAAMCGFHVVAVPSDKEGNMDRAALQAALGPDVAGLMLTLPSTLGLLDPHIVDICERTHRAGGLVYGDGANLNALLGKVKLGALGFDVVHMNLHKTFTTPHGGGGPGAGPVAVARRLTPFLPTPTAVQRPSENGARYAFARPEKSIGRIGAFQGNFGVLVRAYCYIRQLGAPGLREVAENAVLNANYLLAKLKDVYHLPYDRRCMHEVILSASQQKAKGVRALDISKRLIDYGFHPPTMYFPLVVDEALMIEPTETESIETLDAFIAAMRAIAREAEEAPDLVRNAPHTAPITRLDEATAARKPDLRWRPRK